MDITPLYWGSTWYTLHIEVCVSLPARYIQYVLLACSVSANVVRTIEHSSWHFLALRCKHTQAASWLLSLVRVSRQSWRYIRVFTQGNSVLYTENNGAVLHMGKKRQFVCIIVWLLTTINSYTRTWSEKNSHGRYFLCEAKI